MRQEDPEKERSRSSESSQPLEEKRARPACCQLCKGPESFVPASLPTRVLQRPTRWPSGKGTCGRSGRQLRVSPTGGGGAGRAAPSRAPSPPRPGRRSLSPASASLPAGRRVSSPPRQLRPLGRREGRMVHIRDLPEDILLDLLSLVPGRDLVRNCRLVCSQWRDLVDVATLWKRKCQREGYLARGQDKSVPDWKIFYFLCILKRNLIKNHAAEAGFKHWNLESNEGDKWKIENLPGAHGREFPHPHVRKYFVTSYGPCTKLQLIHLKKEGYWDQLMDETKPDIVVKDWYAARYDCGCRYKLNVQLLSANYIVLEEFDPESVVIEQWSDAQWHEITHTFHNYPSGVRYVLFKHGGQDTQFWAGWYGVRVTNSSITVGPEVAS